MLKDRLAHVLYAIFGVLPIKKNRIVCSSFDCHLYGGNPRVISEYLAKKGGYDIIWVLDKSVKVLLPEGIKRVETHSWRKIYYYATAKVWIDSHHFGNRWKRKEQYLIQTWHGAIPLKRLEGGCPEYFSPRHIRDVFNCSKMTDYHLSNSDVATKALRDGLWYHGPVIQVGMPVNDMLINSTDDIQIIKKEELCLDKNVSYVLYAPTCRQSDKEDLVNEIDYERIERALHNRFGGAWRFLYRGHPIADVTKKEKVKSSNVIDVTAVQKIQDLLAVSDVVITDYSSIITDFMHTGRPGFLFAYDYNAYKGKRDFILPLEEWPFPFAKSNDELENNILCFDEKKYKSDINELMTKWDIKETGRSTEVICRVIDEIIHG